jgi:hypothetical protein
VRPGIAALLLGVVLGFEVSVVMPATPEGVLLMLVAPISAVPVVELACWIADRVKPLEPLLAAGLSAYALSVGNLLGSLWAKYVTRQICETEGGCAALSHAQDVAPTYLLVASILYGIAIVTLFFGRHGSWNTRLAKP